MRSRALVHRRQTLCRGILVRTADPARIAALCNEIGIAVDPPSRMNPRGWTGRISFDLLIVDDAAAHHPSVRLCTGEATAAAARLADRLCGTAAPPVETMEDGRAATVTVAGVELTFESADVEVVMTPLDDELLLRYVGYVFKGAEAIAAEVAAVAGADARLAGPTLCGRQWGRGVFALVVDAEPGTDLSAVQAAIDAVRTGPVATIARLACEFDTDLLRGIDHRSWRL